METKKVSVRIFGQDYTIAGERDEAIIREIAQYVDTQMHEIAKFYQGSQPGALATLTAVNAADELFQARDEIAGLKEKIDQLETECGHYMSMWEDAKRSFTQYKDEANSSREETVGLADRVRELEAKIKDYEAAYFELQSENMQLKEELEELDY